jgi:hypothetical protein
MKTFNDFALTFRPSPPSRSQLPRRRYSAGGAFRMEADALETEAAAKRLLADEYDTARRRYRPFLKGNSRSPGRYATRKKRGPGIGRRTINAAVAAGKEPTKARICHRPSNATRCDPTYCMSNVS